MAYQYDIFVSYWRHPETLEWIKLHFLPLLDLRVGLELGSKPQIYVHEVTHQIPAGTAWPAQLGEEIGTSRILISHSGAGRILTACGARAELCLMLAREQETGEQNSTEQVRTRSAGCRARWGQHPERTGSYPETGH